MIACVVCRGETELDDVVREVDVGFGGPVRWCLCLRCHDRQTDARRPVPPALRVAVTATLTDAERRSESP